MAKKRRTVNRFGNSVGIPAGADRILARQSAPGRMPMMGDPDSVSGRLKTKKKRKKY